MMLTGDYDFHGVYHPERVFLAAADTGTLANMAANAMNKVVISQLALLTHYRWYGVDPANQPQTTAAYKTCSGLPSVALGLCRLCLKAAPTMS